MNSITVENLEPNSTYQVSLRCFGDGKDYFKVKKVEGVIMNNYEEVKTVFKEYKVHDRVVTICVKERMCRHLHEYEDWYNSNGKLPKLSFERVITIGLSICNPEDEYNFQFGKQIAEGRADKALEKENQFMYIVGYLRDTPQSKNKFVLSQFAETAFYEFKHNPEKYIVNFNKTIEDET